MTESALWERRSRTPVHGQGRVPFQLFPAPVLRPGFGPQVGTARAATLAASVVTIAIVATKL
jgi:hypothetical protein